MQLALTYSIISVLLALTCFTTTLIVYSSSAAKMSAGKMTCCFIPGFRSLFTVTLLSFLSWDSTGVKLYNVDIPIPRKSASKAVPSQAPEISQIAVNKAGSPVRNFKAPTAKSSSGPKSLFAGMKLTVNHQAYEVLPVKASPLRKRDISSASSEPVKDTSKSQVINLEDEIEPPAKRAPSSSSNSRPDLPTVKHFVRGDKAKALKAVENKPAALKELNEDKFAKSSIGPRDSLIKTWSEFHEAWFQGRVDPFPLTNVIMDALASMFKQGEYRAVANYFSRAQEEHLDLGFDWSYSLTKGRRLAVRAATRGMGPARQSSPLPLEKIMEYLWLRVGTDTPDSNDMSYESLPAWEHEQFVLGVPSAHLPMGFVTLVLIGSLFLMREIEVANCRIGHVTFDYLTRSVSILLPVSKTDIYALGKTRTWACICEGPFKIGAFPLLPCAFCLLKNHLEWLHSTLKGDWGKKSRNLDDWDERPLFPTWGNKGIPVKDMVAKCIEFLGVTVGLCTVDSEGKKVFGGHTMRVSGARFLASIGIEITLIMLFARWISQVVLRYVEETPLVTFSQLVKSKLQTKKVSDAAEKINLLMDKAKELEEQYEHSILALENRSSENGDHPLPQEAWLQNKDSKMVHRVEFMSLNTDPSSWYCYCRWHFAAKSRRYNILAKKAEKEAVKLNRRIACDRCFPHLDVDED